MLPFVPPNIYSSILNAKVDIELNDLLTMTGREFECACSEIFKTLGYSTLITQTTNDEGKDLMSRTIFSKLKRNSMASTFIPVKDAEVLRESGFWPHWRNIANVVII